MQNAAPPTSHTILVVEDDPHVAELLSLALERAGFQVLLAVDGNQALQHAAAKNPALVILDIMLPGPDGWEVCRQLRRRSKVPVLMLTARGEEADKVLGLELGADDYMIKPFSPRELVARVRAILRRVGEAAAPSDRVMEFPHLTIDLPRREVRLSDRPVDLTPKEFELLAALAGQPGRVFTREQLLSQVWGYEYFGDGRTVDEHVRRLRHKLEGTDAPVRYLRTVWGVGYKFEVMG